MVEITSEYVDAIREQEGLIASEKLGGNIVKAEFHKGALFGLKLAVQLLCTPENGESQTTDTQQLKAKIAAIKSCAEDRRKFTTLDDIFILDDMLRQLSAV